MSEGLTAALWVGLALPALLLCQRWIHRHLQGLAYLVTSNRRWAIVAYALVLLPGVFLHELSHWIAARLLGLRTGSFSILPRTKADGSIQLGYVEYYRSGTLDPIRESLIGSAPLLTGTGLLLLMALYIFDAPGLLEAILAGDPDVLVQSLSNLLKTGDLFVWLYLLFAISNAMMPSASDRRAWPAFALILSALAAVLFLLGLQDDVLAQLAAPATVVFANVGLALALAIGVDLVFMIAIQMLEWLVSRIRGVEIVYNDQPSSPPFQSQ